MFLNCPHDPEFQPLFDAAILAITSCGFTPRSALESGTVSEPRMTRITRAIFESNYSIHDLSRCKGEGDSNLARFNMPLELGIAMARGYLSRGKAKKKHDWLVMVPADQRNAPFISDLAGFDLVFHEGSERGIVEAIMVWLVTRHHAVRAPSAPEVLKVLPYFKVEMHKLRVTWGQQPPPWIKVVFAAIRVAKRLG